MTRIIAGAAGSLRLKAPDKVSRPTSDRVREAIFSRLESLIDMEGAAVLDLFAVTGALGLEAASLGARSVWLVENHAGAASVVRANIQSVAKALTHAPTLHASSASVTSFLSGAAPGDISVAFLDPPYDYSSTTLDDHLVALEPWLADEAIVIVERSSKGTPPQFPAGYEALAPRTYGDTTVYWARFLKGSQPPL